MSSQGISNTKFDELGLGRLGHPEPDFVRCVNCDSQGALDQYGKPAYQNFHYGIRFDAKSKCPKCDGLGQHKSLKEFIKRILQENQNRNPTKETDFFKRMVWREFPESDSVEIDTVLYDTISSERDETK
jgi:hypothetical protein